MGRSAADGTEDVRVEVVTAEILALLAKLDDGQREKVMNGAVYEVYCPHCWGKHSKGGRYQCSNNE